MTIDSPKRAKLISLTADVVAAHIANNSVAIDAIPDLIRVVHEALIRISQPAPADAPAQIPAVKIRVSVKPDFLVCLEDGRKVKLLRPYLARSYGMTPHEYRVKWGLPADYPMVAPNYAAVRRDLALKAGLGHRPKNGARGKRKTLSLTL